MRLRVIDPDERDWNRGYLAARRFPRVHNHRRIPLDARDGHDHGYPVGQWAAVQRKRYAAGRLDKRRTRALVMLGMVWSHPDAAFDDGLTVARRRGEAAACGTCPGSKTPAAEATSRSWAQAHPLSTRPTQECASPRQPGHACASALGHATTAVRSPRDSDESLSRCHGRTAGCAA
ncbi:helicase associated domain-containing protein [Embleya sp. NPDC050154]|uniref:helicase associated domain-containing protein n=1 Tax=Embleya sp. NPDC050154 TaxID=3363988 RepID=UPI00379FCA34